MKKTGQNESRMMRHQESRVGVAVAWAIAPLFFTLGSFYLATVWATRNGLDLNAADMQRSFPVAVIGFIVGVLIAIAVTVFYPPYINREYREEEERALLDHHHH
jgi:hypothetical protein